MDGQSHTEPQDGKCIGGEAEPLQGSQAEPRQAPETEPDQGPPKAPQPPLRERPDASMGVIGLLEDQLVESTHLVRDLTDYIMNYGQYPLETRLHSIHHITELLDHSAAVAKVVARLKGIAAESRHVSVIERRGERGEGGA